TKIEFLASGRDPGMGLIFLLADSRQGERRPSPRYFHQVEVLEILELLIGHLVVGEIEGPLEKERAAVIGLLAGLINFPRPKSTRGAFPGNHDLPAPGL